MNTSAQAVRRPSMPALPTEAVPALMTGYLYTGLGLLFALVLLDFLDTRTAAAGDIGTVLWFVSYAYIAVFAGICLYRVVAAPKLFSSPFTIVVLLAFAAVIAVNVTDVRNVSGETSIETNCAVTHLTTGSDRGYHQTCLFGYPVRQQFLPSVPTLLFGRNQLDLNLGGSLYFVLGALIFAGCALEFLKYTRAGDILTATLLACLLHVFYFGHFLLLAEQSVFPLCFGLMLAGLGLHYLTHRDQLSIVLCGLVLLYLVSSYTPSLSLFFLGIVVLGFFAFRGRGRDEVVLIALVILLAVASLRISLTYRQDIHLADTGNRSAHLLVQDLMTALDQILFAGHGSPFVSPVLTFPFLFVMAASLLLFFGWEAAAVAGWAVLSIVLAVVSRGYEYYPIDFRLHRAMIIFPVLFALVAVVWSRSKWRPRHEYLAVAALIIVATGLNFLFDYRNSLAANPHAVFGKWLQTHVKGAAKPTQNPRTLWLVDGAYNARYISLNDEMTYFDPGLHAEEFQQGAFGSHCGVSSDLAGVFVVPTVNGCFHAFAGTEGGRRNFVYDGTFVDPFGESFGVFERG